MEPIKESLMERSTVRFCAQCLDDMTNIHTVMAYCKYCKEFICSESCLKQHAKFRLSKTHTYMLGSDLKEILSREFPKDGELSPEMDAEDAPGTFTMKNAVLRTEYNIRDKSDVEICSIHASLVLPDGRLVLADLKNNNVKLYDTGPRKCVFVMRLEHGPRDICLSNADNDVIYVVESGASRIHQAKINGDEIDLVKTMETEGECFGITCWKRGIAVTMSTFKTTYGHYELRLLDYKGHFRRKFVSGKVQDLEFNLPWYLHAIKEGQFVLISDYGNHRVTCVNVDHGVLFVYTDSDLVRPVSMATDTKGDIFVVGQRSHNIHHVSEQCEKKGVIYSKHDMEFPGGLSYDKAKDVFYVQCTGWSDQLQQFKFEFDPLGSSTE